MKKFIAAAMTMLMVFSLAACRDSTTATPGTAGNTGNTVSAPEYVISVSVTTSDDSACNKAIYYMADLVKERSGGRVELDVYPNGTMANDVGSVEGVQMGTIGMTLVSSANYTQFDSNQAVFDLPFLFPTKEDAYRFFESDLAGKLAESLGNYGFHCFGYMDYGYRLLTNDVKEVQSMADLKGMKIRTMSSTYQVQTWECLDAVPTVISFSELFTALQQHTVDGQENPWGNIISQKFYEVQKYATDTHHILTVCPLVMSQDIYDSMPEDLQKVMDECAADTLVAARDMVNEEESGAVETATAAGMVVTSASDDMIQEMREACQPVYDSMKQEIGDIVTQVEDFFA
ncbi:MAG: TRAP transporter substrate-binding protein [Oscillospiraceae bacterium]|uniref:ABC transporter substrate-binding protein n=1 Tax=Pusillibacter faecalis TaxID=2714358 RepID=A0A810Q7L2_9FIRM|nr:TRAP transporter substrate-binding protein [Pusillibacter faecalis]BCK84268.1 ABC transporter substrate-binding protein [Pusillibacter faecalis]